LLADAFGHHVWATVELIDACLALDQEQLETSVPGTYGSILATMRHLVGADASFLPALTGERVAVIDAEHLDLAELRIIMERDGAAWSALLARDPDPDAIVVWHRGDGSESHAPMGIRLAQALHHGTHHRSQACTALTVLGFEPPEIDVADFAWQAGRLVEVPPTA
jgi:uncharacterized damage-inducible protein DinB